MRLTKNRTRRAASGLIVDYLGTGVNQVLSFLVTPVLISLLSPSIYGFWIIVTQIIFWLGLLDGGVGIYLIKAIASSKEKEDPSHLSKSVSTCFWIYVFLAVVVVCIVMIIAPFLPGWVKIESAQYGASMLAFQIAVITASISLILVSTFYAILQGYQQIALVNFIGIRHRGHGLGTTSDNFFRRDGCFSFCTPTWIIQFIPTFFSADRTYASISVYFFLSNE